MRQSAFVAAAASTITALHKQPVAAAGQRPNVLLILTDDQGYGDLGCYGNQYLKTPNIDRLHSESTRLTQYHNPPVCAPTRASLKYS